jgi:hypothetical protein
MTNKYTSELLEFIRLIVEELSEEEVDALDAGNTLIDPELNVVTVDAVMRDEKDKIKAADVIRYETPASTEDEPILYRRSVGAKELEKYEVA